MKSRRTSLPLILHHIQCLAARCIAASLDFTAATQGRLTPCQGSVENADAPGSGWQSSRISCEAIRRAPAQMGKDCFLQHTLLPRDCPTGLCFQSPFKPSFLAENHDIDFLPSPAANDIDRHARRSLVDASQGSIHVHRP